MMITGKHLGDLGFKLVPRIEKILWYYGTPFLRDKDYSWFCIEIRDGQYYFTTGETDWMIDYFDMSPKVSIENIKLLKEMIELARQLDFTHNGIFG